MNTAKTSCALAIQFLNTEKAVTLQGLSVPPVTRGGDSANRTSIDWMTCTFQNPGITAYELIHSIKQNLDFTRIKVQMSGGLNGFTEHHAIYAYPDGMKEYVGSVCCGGSSQANCWMLVITGQGCKYVRDWDELLQFLKTLKAKITRVDLAIDFLQGEYSVDDAVLMFEQGDFRVRGRQPSSHVAGDWLYRREGRTLYVGKAENGKKIRVYEKGKQLGDLNSPWVRWEVQYQSAGKIIPLDALTNPDTYFAGSYPALAKILPVAATSISSRKKEKVSDLGHKLYHLKRSYGGVINQALNANGSTADSLITELRCAKPEATSTCLIGLIDWKEVEIEIQNRSINS